MKSDAAQPFNVPVDPDLLGIPVSMTCFVIHTFAAQALNALVNPVVL